MAKIAKAAGVSGKACTAHFRRGAIRGSPALAVTKAMGLTLTVETASVRGRR